MITAGAVEKHVTAIFDKLGIDRSSEATAAYWRCSSFLRSR